MGYDGHNNISAFREQVGSGRTKYETTFSYDSAERPVTIQYGNIVNKVTYTYDADAVMQGAEATAPHMIRSGDPRADAECKAEKLASLRMQGKKRKTVSHPVYGMQSGFSSAADSVHGSGGVRRGVRRPPCASEAAG